MRLKVVVSNNENRIFSIYTGFSRILFVILSAVGAGENWKIMFSGSRRHSQSINGRRGFSQSSKVTLMISRRGDVSLPELKFHPHGISPSQLLRIY